MISRVELQAAFDKVDKDKSGTIELGELSTLCEATGLKDYKQEDAAALFKEIDTNHDGKISFEEFCAWYRLGRNSKLRDYLKYTLKGVQGFDKHFTQKYKSIGLQGAEGRTKLLEVDLRDGEPNDDGTTMVAQSLHPQPNPTDQERVKKANPGCALSSDDLAPLMGNSQHKHAFASMFFKSSNPAALAKAFETFFNAAQESIIEEAPESKQVFDMFKKEIGVDGDFVVVTMPHNPMTEGPLVSFSQILPMLSLSKPEAVLQYNTDHDWSVLRSASNFLEHTDKSRLFVELTIDNQGKKDLLEFVSQFKDEAKEAEAGFNAFKLFQGFKLKAIFNPDNHKDSGNVYANVIKALTAGQEIDMDMVKKNSKKGLDKVADAKKHNWASVKDELRGEVAKKDGDVKKFRAEWEKRPFCNDLVEAFKAHGTNNMKFSMFVGDFQLSMQQRMPGFLGFFQEAFDIVMGKE